MRFQKKKRAQLLVIHIFATLKFVNQWFILHLAYYFLFNEHHGSALETKCAIKMLKNNLLCSLKHLLTLHLLAFPNLVLVT